MLFPFAAVFTMKAEAIPKIGGLLEWLDEKINAWHELNTGDPIYEFIVSDPLGRLIETMSNSLQSFGISVKPSPNPDTVSTAIEAAKLAARLYDQLTPESKKIVNDVNDRRQHGGGSRKFDEAPISLDEYAAVKREIQEIILRSENGNFYYDFTEGNRQLNSVLPSDISNRIIFPEFPVVSGRPNYFLFYTRDRNYRLVVYSGKTLVIVGQNLNGVLPGHWIYDLDLNNENWVLSHVEWNTGILSFVGSTHFYSSVDIYEAWPNEHIVYREAGWLAGYWSQGYQLQGEYDDPGFYHGTCSGNLEKYPFVLESNREYTIWHYVTNQNILKGKPPGEYFVDFKVETIAQAARYYVKLNNSDEWVSARIDSSHELLYGVYLSIKGNSLFTSAVFGNNISERFELGQYLAGSSAEFLLPNRIYVNFTAGAPDREMDLSNIYIDKRIFNTTLIEDNWQTIINNGGDTYQTMKIWNIDEYENTTIQNILSETIINNFTTIINNNGGDPDENFFIRLFVPRASVIQGYAENIKNTWDRKFGVFGQFSELADEFIEVLEARADDGAPNFEIELYDQKMNIIDFSFFDDYIDYIRIIIVALLWIAFVIRMYKRLPRIIGGDT